jgi:hypothetical protein
MAKRSYDRICAKLLLVKSTMSLLAGCLSNGGMLGAEVGKRFYKNVKQFLLVIILFHII